MPPARSDSKKGENWISAMQEPINFNVFDILRFLKSINCYIHLIHFIQKSLVIFALEVSGCTRLTSFFRSLMLENRQQVTMLLFEYLAWPLERRWCLVLLQPIDLEEMINIKMNLLKVSAKQSSRLCPGMTWTTIQPSKNKISTWNEDHFAWKITRNSVENCSITITTYKARIL